ncbi:MAG: hypothetical protein E3J66_03860, partial [Dehalococcoidia bacterium]
MEVKQLYLAWQNPKNRSWYPVGALTIDENGTYRFVYTKGAQSSENFAFFGRMTDPFSVYESKELFPLFKNRLLAESRPEYKKYLKWLDIGEDEDNPFNMLAMTEGIKATDTLEVFKCPTPNGKGRYEVDFFSHGLRHVAKRVIERVNHLRKGERLFLARDMQNRYDSMAMALRTDDPVEFVGYCPRYLSPDFQQLLEKDRAMDVLVTVERVNEDAPLNLRLLCKLVAPWPAGFQPCSGDKFKPLVKYSHGVKSLPKIETPVGIRGVPHNSPLRDLRSKGRHDISNGDSKKSSGMVDYLPTGRVIGSSKTSMKNTYYGRRQEEKVARQLRGHGAEVKLSPGSRGAADLKAKFPSGRSWNVQVKSSRSGTPASPSAKELGR